MNGRPYRRFLAAFAVFLVAYLAFHYVVWKTCTERILSPEPAPAGDLARIGYLPRYAAKHPVIVDLARRHVEAADWDGRHVDVLTVGDSYANGGGGGKNPYFQDYLATRFGLEVLNVQPHRDLGLLGTVAWLQSSGMLDRMGAPEIVVECAERLAVVRMADGARLDGDAGADHVEKWLRSTRYRSELPRPSFLNAGNLKFVAYHLLYLVSDHALWSDTYVRDVRANLWTGPDPDRLLFFKEDLDGVKLSTPDNVRRVNDSVNALADLLAAGGRKLHFMPVVDKYELYAPYLVNDPYPRNHLFETLRSLPRHYELVDTKAILDPLVAAGVKDVFHADDSHWTWVASEAVTTTMAPRAASDARLAAHVGTPAAPPLIAQDLGQ